MSDWLFNSQGEPVAFVHGDHVFSRTGKFLGNLDPDGTVWRGSYIGEIVRENRFLYKTTSQHSRRGPFGLPGTPAIPSIPASKHDNGLPSGFRDVEIEQ